MQRKPNKRALLGPAAFLVVGGLLLAVGGRYVVFESLLHERGERVLGTITHVGSQRSDGGSVNTVRFTFEDLAGRQRHGRASGYSGSIGETLALEVVPDMPFVHRVAGAGNAPPYRFRWAILGAGLLFSVIGTHGWYRVRDRQRLLARLSRAGARCAGIVRRIVRAQRVIEYEYSARDGSRHTGRTHALPQGSLDGLDNGATVTVIYDAARPDASVLELEV